MGKRSWWPKNKSFKRSINQKILQYWEFGKINVTDIIVLLLILGWNRAKMVCDAEMKACVSNSISLLKATSITSETPGSNSTKPTFCLITSLQPYVYTSGWIRCTCSLPESPLPWLELLEMSTGIGSNWLSKLLSPVSEDWKTESRWAGSEAAGRG